MLKTKIILRNCTVNICQLLKYITSFKSIFCLFRFNILAVKHCMYRRKNFRTFENKTRYSKKLISSEPENPNDK